MFANIKSSCIFTGLNTNTMKKYHITYSYINSNSQELTEKTGIKISASYPTEIEILEWAKHNTWGGAYDFKIMNICAK